MSKEYIEAELENIEHLEAELKEIAKMTSKK
jgi:hypothetical protein